MSETTENKQCQICKGYLFADDDVVVCPICGAPHHRDCWNAVGHCGAEENHGTENQYDVLKGKAEKDKAAALHEQPDTVHTCPNCHRTSKTPGAEFCPYCGHSYNVNRAEPHVFAGEMPNPFDIYGGLPKDATIDGVKIKDIATFVGSNSARYINRFSALNKKRKGSWNWAAFLFPSGWCFSRKMFPLGIIYTILSIASTICMVPFTEIVEELSGGQALSYSAAYALVENNLKSFDLFALLFAFLGVALNLIPRIICGRLGDWNYRTFALGKVKGILNNNEIEDKELQLRRSGNVSLLWLMGALLAVQYLPLIILNLI